VYTTDLDKKLTQFGRLLNAAGILAAAAIGLAVWYVALRPLDGQIDDCRENTTDLLAFLTQEDQLGRERDQLQRDLDDAKRQAAAVQERIPGEPLLAEFLAQVSSLAKQVGVQIPESQRGAIVRKPAYATLKVVLVCNGDYTGMCKFLEKLRRLPRHSSIERMQIDTADEGCSATISVILYFAPPVLDGQDK